MRTIITIVLLAMGLLLGSPSHYSIRKAAGFSPIIDGHLNEWPESAFLDSLHGDQNVFARSGQTDWTRDDFQMRVSAVYDSQWIYFAIKIVSDDKVLYPDSSASVCTGDNLKVNPGGQAMAFYISISGQAVLNPGCPFVLNSTLKARGHGECGSGQLPCYEFAFKRSELDVLNLGSFQLSIGSEDIDGSNPDDACFLGLGVEYYGPKHGWDENAWDNPRYYPVFHLATTLQTEKTDTAAQQSDGLIIWPNPCNPAATIGFHTAKQENINLSVYSLTGCLITTLFSGKADAGSHSCGWNSSGIASGWYVARLTASDRVYKHTLLLIR